MITTLKAFADWTDADITEWIETVVDNRLRDIATTGTVVTSVIISQVQIEARRDLVDIFQRQIDLEV